MKKTFTLAICIIFLGFNAVNAQVFKKFDPVICPVDHNSYDTFVPPPEKFQALAARGVTNQSTESTANIIVNYNGFSEEAKVAYQYAVDIWASILKSPVTIHVNANYVPLGQGVLGSAGPSDFVRDFDGAPVQNTFYPIALAEKIAGKDLNKPGNPDINSNFNSDFNFYLGTDGNPPAGQYDFVSIVLHELGHGLGFIGLASYENSQGSWSAGETGKTSIYTEFVNLGDGTPIIDLPDNSEETGDALTSNNLFFNGPISVNQLGEEPKLYTPSTWNGGSSYSHLDENEYGPGNENSLMSPQFGAGEAIHAPGITYELFADMGWIHTYMQHQNGNQITENINDDFVVDLSVFSDTTFNEKVPELVYSLDDFQSSNNIVMTDTGNGKDFTASIPNPGETSTIKYYFQGVEDGTGRNYTAPADAPNKFYTVNIVALQDKSLPYTLAEGGDFETNASDWQSIIINGNENHWEYGQPGNVLNSAISGNNVWKTKLSEDIGFADLNSSSALVSPTFDFSSENENIELSFNFMMANATTTNGFFNQGPFGLQMEFSLDRGQTWEVLGTQDDPRAENWYNFRENSPSVFSINDNSGWIEQTYEVNNGDTTLLPLNAKYNVSFLGGNQNVNFRLVFYVVQDFPEAGYEADGVLVDDFEILSSDPTADFISTSTALNYTGDQINFEYISAGATSYSWDFGDGNTSNQENPSHSYASGGVYDVSLTITSDAGNATVVKENLIKIIPTRQVPYQLEDGGNLEQAEVDFSIQNVSGTGFVLGRSEITGKAGTASGDFAFVTAPDAELYENNSEAYIYTPEFDFKSLGDYQFSFETNYQFEDNWDGFIVEYTVDRGENWIKLKDELEDNWYTQISDPQSVFGNEVPIFSGNTENEFVKKFTDVSFLAGAERVSFRIKFLTDAAEVDAGMAIDNFEILGPLAGPAIPDFSAEVEYACEGATIVFSNESLGSIKDLQWDFGEGAEPQFASGTGPHEIKFSTAGSYDVTLTAEDLNGAFVTETKEEFINIGLNHFPSISIGERSNDFTVLLTASEGESYQWFLNGDSIPDATEQTYLAIEDGQYYVAVLVENCVGFSNVDNIITSNDSPLARSFSAFPNPLNKNRALNISFENEYLGDYNVEVYSLNGRRIFSEKFNKVSTQEVQEIDLKKAIEGLYLVRVTTGSQSTQIKVLIE
ncbi:hypothetical protein MATR_02100 [Marivirga tractuosa]|uniref:PKD domain containing protein n=1 Tax=Marivirga tractuosa (strain ATCC 23168 / DSM 4126 / NBRC 15989 / NCIMB 1408 / VKM B-1430 / H-43) TaxID=643867 RepID=E4TV59_MARTH|nr:PKD domain-containing protein [Marivirga tractuosa]ADR22152.1 PKD domain containing protein [Marivirga tractuosa DSM 4126]BDD13385.1 hypothetical protein MATR_02100 [Marivirga tractuosa]